MAIPRAELRPSKLVELVFRFSRVANTEIEERCLSLQRFDKY